MSETDVFSAELQQIVEANNAPKKKRGRQLGTPNRNTATRKLGNLKEQFDTLLRTGNAVFQSVKPQLAIYALNDEEIAKLRDALVVEFNANPKLQKMVTAFGSVSPHIALVSALGSIAIARYYLYQTIKLRGIRQTEQPDYAPEYVEHPEPVNMAPENGNSEPRIASVWP